MSLIRKKLTFICVAVVTAIAILLAEKSQSSPKLALEVLSASDANVKFKQQIKGGDRVLTNRNGFAFMTLQPWKSINIDQLACTDFAVEQLAPTGDGTILSVSYKNRLLCPSRAFVRVTSNFVSTKSGIKGDVAGRLVRLKGTQMAASTAADGSLLIGVNEGTVEVAYWGTEQAIAPGEYLRSLDNSPLPLPKMAPEPYIDSIGRQKSGLYRVCTHLDNQILVGGIAPPQTGKGQTCADIPMDVQWVVVTPTGKSLGWHFPSSARMTTNG